MEASQPRAPFDKMNRGIDVGAGVQAKRQGGDVRRVPFFIRLTGVRAGPGSRIGRHGMGECHGHIIKSHRLSLKFAVMVFNNDLFTRRGKKSTEGRGRAFDATCSGH